VFTRFSSRGALAALETGDPAGIDTSRLSGEHAGQQPLDNQVVDFGEEQPGAYATAVSVRASSSAATRVSGPGR
jgi:hypothetical protein